MNRRRFLGTAGAFAVMAVAPLTARSQGRPLRYADMHSHIGIRGAAEIRSELAGNGMLLVARKIVADSPVIRSVPGQGWRVGREATPAELSGYFEKTLQRMREQHQREGLVEVASAATLERLRGGSAPGIVLAAEGGDFLEGDLRRLEAARTAGLIHLQLVHYRVSELGDISTERPVHGGLTAFGREVIAACNRLGILVDVAHGTSALIEQALELAARPIVYSHGHMTSSEPHYTQNPVGVGTDLAGLPSSVVPGYAEFAALEEALVRRGIKAGDIENMLGGNYLRVLGRSLAG
ncbi:MAG TPA: membrane dipeptidase [Burkholderiales bacterium]|nr:membrane dipeptidase [Burkholderiales bacterium]